MIRVGIWRAVSLCMSKLTARNTRNVNTSNLTKQLEIEAAERQAMEAAKRMARLVGKLKASS